MPANIGLGGGGTSWLNAVSRRWAQNFNGGNLTSGVGAPSIIVEIPYQRVYSIPIDIDDNGVETVKSPLMASTTPIAVPAPGGGTTGGSGGGSTGGSGGSNGGGSGGGGGSTGGGGVGGGDQQFAASSPINQPFPADVPIHPDSPAMIACPQWDDGNAWMFLNMSHLYYEAPAGFDGVPYVDMYVNDSIGGGGCATVPVSAPWPDIWTDILNLSPWETNPGYYPGDAMTTIWEAGNGDTYVGYHSTPPGQNSRNITCSSSRFNSPLFVFRAGLYKGIGCGEPWTPPSGSGITAGMIRPSDFASVDGVIPHAIQIIYNSCPFPGDVHPPYVFPATGAANDGQVSGTGAIPTGARLRLNPNIDVDTWPSFDFLYGPILAACLRKIARTFQVYGAITVDGIGGSSAAGQINLEMVAPLGSNGYPWEQEVGAPWYGTTLVSAFPEDLMAEFEVVDWRFWTGG